MVELSVTGKGDAGAVENNKVEIKKNAEALALLNSSMARALIEAFAGYNDTVATELEQIRARIVAVDKYARDIGRCAIQDVMVANIAAGTKAHQTRDFVKNKDGLVKYSDRDINNMRERIGRAKSVMKLECGECVLYVKEDKDFNADAGDRSSIHYCSKGPGGPFIDSGYHGHALHFGIDCWMYGERAGIGKYGAIYDDNHGGGCNCHGAKGGPGKLTVLNAISLDC